MTDESFIQPDFRAIIKPEMVGTFRDVRQPLMVRLERYAEAEVHEYAAKSLLLEARDRLRGALESQGRISAVRSVETEYFLNARSHVERAKEPLLQEIADLRHRIDSSLCERVKRSFRTIFRMKRSA